MEDLYSHPVIHWLLRMSWQASVLVALIFLAQILFRKHLTPKWRYVLWALVVARLLVPVSVPSSMSIFNLFQPLATQVANSTLLRPQSTTGVKADPQAASSSVAVKQVVTKREREPGTLDYLMLGLSDYPLPVVIIFVLFTIIWPAGILFLSFRIIHQNFRFTWRLRKARQLENPEVRQLFEDCKLMLGIDQHIPIIETEYLKTPAVYGFLSPRLLLPKGMVESFSLQELRHILLHELAHVKRLDMAVNWLMAVLQVLHWFNPIIWFGFERVREDREVACDALALSRSRDGEHTVYGETLIKLLQHFITPDPVPGGLVGLMEKKNDMKQRVMMIAGFTRRASMRSLFGLLVVAAFVCVGMTDAKVPSAAPNNLVGWWRGEGTLSDAVGNADAVAEGSLNFVPGPSGPSVFHFDGREADIKIPASPALVVGRESGFTISLWIKPTDLNQTAPLIEWNSGHSGVALILMNQYGNGALYASLTDTNRERVTLATESGLIQADQFQQVVFTYHRGKGAAAFYVNGRCVATSFVGELTPDTHGDVYLGVIPYGEMAGTRYAGEMANVQVFDSVMTPEQIKMVYEAGRHGNLPKIFRDVTARAGGLKSL